MDDGLDIGERLSRWNDLTPAERQEVRRMLREANDEMRGRQIEEDEIRRLRRSFSEERPIAAARAAPAAVTAPAAPTQAEIVRAVLAALKTPLAGERNIVMDALWPALQKTLVLVLSAERKRVRAETAAAVDAVRADLAGLEARLMAEITRRVSEVSAQALGDIQQDLRSGFDKLLDRTDEIARRYEPTPPPRKYPWAGGPGGMA